jgi:bifunctional non-homologous end joining protein LigD
MARAPRRPREIQRIADAATETVASPAIVRRVDARQADLFDVPFIPPAKPTLATRVPVGPRGHDYAARLPGIVADLAALPVRSAVIDGEACIAGPDGITDFFALHGALARKSAPDAILYAFDLLYVDGEDLRARPLVERRTRLAEIVAGAGSAIVLSGRRSIRSRLRL